MENKNVLLIIVVLLLLIIGGYVLKYTLMPVKTLTTQIDSGLEIIDKTYDSENAIYNYEWFKSQHEKIEANRNKITNQMESIMLFKETYGNVTEWDFSTKEEYNRQMIILNGLRSYDEDITAEYNARAKMVNRNIFMNKLPLSVDKMLW